MENNEAEKRTCYICGTLNFAADNICATCKKKNDIMERQIAHDMKLHDDMVKFYQKHHNKF